FVFNVPVQGGGLNPERVGKPSHAQPIQTLLIQQTQCGIEFVESGGSDRKSTRLNSSHVKISYAVFCLKKKKKNNNTYKNINIISYIHNSCYTIIVISNS